MCHTCMRWCAPHAHAAPPPRARTAHGCPRISQAPQRISLTRITKEGQHSCGCHCAVYEAMRVRAHRAHRTVLQPQVASHCALVHRRLFHDFEYPIRWETRWVNGVPVASDAATSHVCISTYLHHYTHATTHAYMRQHIHAAAHTYGSTYMRQHIHAAAHTYGSTYMRQHIHLPYIRQHSTYMRQHLPYIRQHIHAVAHTCGSTYMLHIHAASHTCGTTYIHTGSSAHWQCADVCYECRMVRHRIRSAYVAHT